MKTSLEMQLPLKKSELTCKPEDDMPGRKFGSWLVLSFVANYKPRHKYYLCRCDCGYEGIRPGSYLRTAATWCKNCRHKKHRGWSSRMKKRK